MVQQNNRDGELGDGYLTQKHARSPGPSPPRLFVKVKVHSQWYVQEQKAEEVREGFDEEVCLDIVVILCCSIPTGHQLLLQMALAKVSPDKLAQAVD